MFTWPDDIRDPRTALLYRCASDWRQQNGRLRGLPQRTHAQPNESVPSAPGTSGHAFPKPPMFRNATFEIASGRSFSRMLTVLRLLCGPKTRPHLITGVIDGDPNADDGALFTSLNSFFKISTLWGVKNTAPYFHDEFRCELRRASGSLCRIRFRPASSAIHNHTG